MSTEALIPEILRGGETAVKRFDPKSAAPFVSKSVSKATRRAYGQAVGEFFKFVGMKHLSQAVPQDAVLWKDRLRLQKKSAAPVAFKLSVVHSFFEYLKAAQALPSTPSRLRWFRHPSCRLCRGGATT